MAVSEHTFISQNKFKIQKPS